MNTIEKKTKWFSILMALFPLLSYYNSPVPGIDMGSFLLLIFSVFAVSRFWSINDFTPVYLYVLIITPLSVFLSPELNTTFTAIFLRYAKFVVVLGCVFGFEFFNKFYDEKLTFKVMRYLIYLCAVFIVLQRIFYLGGITIENPLIRFSTDDSYINEYSMGTVLFRPSAFFLEPSHLAVYGLVYLIYSLFKEDNLKQSVIVFITILCSGSGIGLIFGVLAYSAYFVIRFRKHVVKIFLAVCVGIVALIGMSRMTFFQMVISRVTTNDVIGGNAIRGRIGIGYQLFLEKNWLQQLLGSGYGNVTVDTYLNGMAYILNTIGIIGCIIFLVLILKYIYKGETWQKIGLLAVLGLTIGSQIFTPASLAFYFCVYNRQSYLDKGVQ